VYNQQAFGDVQRLFVMQTGLDHVRLVGLYDYMTGANPVCRTRQKLLAEFTVPLTSWTFQSFNVGQARLNKARWMSVHLEQGGATKFLDRVWNIWGNSYATSAILHFLLFDPASATVWQAFLRGKSLGLRIDVTKPPFSHSVQNYASLPDPRPGMAPTFYAPGTARILARTSWTASTHV
jgi:hypothetical protein